MKKIVKLVCTTESNNNKYYNMEMDDNSSSFTVKYGRVGGVETTGTKSASDWDKVYREKTKKGYKDVTEYFIIDGEFTEGEEVNEGKPTQLAKDFMDNRPAAVIEIVRRLQAYANKTIEENYTVTASKVTRKQVEKAQEVLSSIAVNGFDETKINTINEALKELYTIVPRKMKYVPDHLLSSVATKAESEKKFGEIMNTEQDLLDTMNGQVKTIEDQKNKDKAEDTNKDHFIDILEAAGLEMEPVTDPKIIAMIKDKMQSKKGMFKHAFAVVNKKTQKRYDEHLSKCSNKYTELYWHGSRSENWWNILGSGLLIRPSGAVYSGSMFGDGIYYASEYDKSLGYTSINGSRWANGGKNNAFLALFEVHLGKQLKLTSSDSSLSKKKLKDKGDYDSTWGQKGSSLYRDEYIVYDSSQCTIKYLIEVEGSQY